jgi:hypothetical protein
MKIERLRALNVKRLDEIDLVLGDAALVIVGGNNGAGKTSVLDSIWMALGGATAVPERPIRDGQEEASVELDLGDWTVTRRWLRNGPGDLTVRNRDGDSKSRPQSWLDGLVGSLSFDPLAFSRQSPRAQADTLRTLVGLDTAQLDAVHARVYEERRAENRELKSLEARLAATPEVEAPDEVVSVSGLSERLREAMASNAQRESLLHALDRAAARVMAAQGELDRLRAEVVRAKAAVDEAEQAEDMAAKAVETAPPVIAIGEIQAEIAAAEDTNTRVRAKRARAGLAAQVEAARKESDRLTGELERVEESKAELLAAAEFPVPDLSLDGETVTYRGIPLAQSSSSEQLRVSLAMGLAMNPKLKVVLIRDGSLLDHDSLRIVEEMAVAAGAQVWVERVSQDGPTTYIIEDGRVKAQAAELVSAAERERARAHLVEPGTDPVITAREDRDR